MNWYNRCLPLLAMLLLAAGCITTRATVAPNASLGQYRTFAFYPEANSAIDRTPTGAVIRDSITRALAERGIYPATGGSPDFYVGYQLVLREELAASGPGGWGGWGWDGWGWGWGGSWNAYAYTEGTLVVDFVDRRTNNSFWRGTATSVVNTPENPNPKTMRKAVAKMIDRYPVELVATAPGRTAM
jgi:CubicO group peptidase (beta-lactamase class C family)